MVDWLQKLSLLVATAVAGFLLGPYLTTRWQDHKEQLDRRSALVERISNSVSAFAGAARVESYRGSAASQFDRAYVDWQVASEGVYTQIAAYSSKKVAAEWSNFEYDMNWVYDVFKKTGAVKPGVALRRVADYLRRPVSTFNGLLDGPFRRDDPTRVNQTYEGALEELTLQLQIREHRIISDILT